VALIADRYLWGHACRGKGVAARFEHFPERKMGVLRVPHEIFSGHLEGEGLQLNSVLAASECLLDEAVDFFHLVVGHGVTAD